MGLNRARNNEVGCIKDFPSFQLKAYLQSAFLFPVHVFCRVVSRLYGAVAKLEGFREDFIFIDKKSDYNTESLRIKV